MKFRIGLPSHDPDFEKSNSDWIILNSINSSIIMGIILGLFLALILELIIKHYTLCSDFNFVVIRKIYLFVVIIPLHEMLHLVFFPSIKNSTLGIAIKKGLFYVTTQDNFTKTRFLAIILFPLIILTIIPFISLFFIKSDWLANIALYNLIGSGVDIITFFYIFNLPSKHLFRFIGTELYIKPAS